MAVECVNVYEAKEILASNRVIEKEEWKRIDDRPFFSEEGNIVGNVYGGGGGRDEAIRVRRIKVVMLLT